MKPGRSGSIAGARGKSARFCRPPAASSSSRLVAGVLPFCLFFCISCLSAGGPRSFCAGFPLAGPRPRPLFAASAAADFCSGRRRSSRAAAPAPPRILGRRGAGGREAGLLRPPRRPPPTSSVMRAARGSSGDDDGKDPDDSSGVQEPSSTTSSWLLTLCLPLWLVYVSNQWSRFSIQSLVDFSPSASAPAAGDSASAVTAMNVELGFNEAQYGILASVAFTSLFAVASVGAGYLSDRLRDRRKLLTVGSAAAWGAATLGMSLAGSYGQVAACRVLTGLACAFSTPVAYTLLQQRVPEGQRALASSLYGTGVAAASALTALSIVLDDELGWRSTLLLIASTGFASAVASLVLLPGDEEDGEAVAAPPNKKAPASPVKKEEGAGTAASASPSFLDEVQDVLASSGRVRWIYLASLIRFGCGLTIGVWSAPYFRLAYPASASRYAAWQAAISAVGATASGVAGGAAADWLSSGGSAGKGGEHKVQEGLLGRRLWIPVLGSLLAAPAWYLAVQANQTFEVSMYWLALEYLVAECWFGPTISTLQGSVRPGSGGTAQGIFTLTGAVGNLAPSVVGFLYASASSAPDAAASSSGSGAEALSGLLAAGVAAGYLASAACFAVASREPGSLPPARFKSKEA